jgi:hypothetical protein
MSIVDDDICTGAGSDFIVVSYETTNPISPQLSLGPNGERVDAKLQVHHST